MMWLYVNCLIKPKDWICCKWWYNSYMTKEISIKYYIILPFRPFEQTTCQIIHCRPVLNSGNFISFRCTVWELLKVPDVVVVDCWCVNVRVAPISIFLLLRRLQLLPQLNKATKGLTKWCLCIILYMSMLIGTRSLFWTHPGVGIVTLLLKFAKDSSEFIQSSIDMTSSSTFPSIYPSFSLSLQSD